MGIIIIIESLGILYIPPNLILVQYLELNINFSDSFVIKNVVKGGTSLGWLILFMQN